MRGKTSRQVRHTRSLHAAARSSLESARLSRDAVGAVVVALSRIAAANTNPTRRAIGVTATSSEPGAAVGVGAALIVAAGALVGLLQSDGRPGG